MNLYDLIEGWAIDEMIAQRYVNDRKHPHEPLGILNYTAQAQYDRAWNDVTRQCRGLIYHTETREVVARPWPKFHNYGEHQEVCSMCGGTGQRSTAMTANGRELERHERSGTKCDACKGTGRSQLALLDLDAPARVMDKMDGSLGIAYQLASGAWAIATRGSFTSDQALIATGLLQLRDFHPDNGATYLFEIIYPGNRVVVDYGDLNALVLLGGTVTETGALIDSSALGGWDGSRVGSLAARTLREALELEPRPNSEGLVVAYLDGSNLMVKIKQADYVALHRILTGTNARNVWEWAAVNANKSLIRDPKHWGSYLGIGPERAAELIEVGDDWLENVPDEFHSWVQGVINEAVEKMSVSVAAAQALMETARSMPDRQLRYEYVHQSGHPAEKAILRVAEGREDFAPMIVFKAWREACPAPTAPFARSEDVA